MTEEYELSVYDRHELNYDHVALGRLPSSAADDPMVLPVQGFGYLPAGQIERSETCYREESADDNL